MLACIVGCFIGAVTRLVCSEDIGGFLVARPGRVIGELSCASSWALFRHV